MEENEKTNATPVDTEAVRRHIKQSIEHYRAQVQRFEANLAPGYRRRRSGYNQLDEKGLLTVDFIYKEYPLILNKQSSLPAGMRRTVRAIGDEALMLYLGEKKRQEEAAKKQKQQTK